MKTPDKIYFQDEAVFRTEKTFDNDVCYIRKDALFDYIHQELEKFLNRNGGVITGRLWCDALAVLDFVDSLKNDNF